MKRRRATFASESCRLVDFAQQGADQDTVRKAVQLGCDLDLSAGLPFVEHVVEERIDGVDEDAHGVTVKGGLHEAAVTSVGLSMLR